jgi:hypothetical protein
MLHVGAIGRFLPMQSVDSCRCDDGSAGATGNRGILVIEPKWSLQKRLLIASIGSFGVYFAPLIGPHAVWLFGESLVHELSGGVHREAAWIAADVALALAAQTTAGLLLLWSLGGNLLRLVAIVICIAFLYVAVATAYLIAIPSRFLIEPDTAPEVQNWTERCVVPDASLMQVRKPITLTDDGAPEWWVQHSDGRLGLLEVPGCARR